MKNYDRQSYSNTFLNCVIFGHSKCSVELISSLEKADMIHSNKCAQIFSVYCGISQVGQDSRNDLAGEIVDVVAHVIHLPKQEAHMC